VDVTIRSATPDDLDEVLAMVRALAEFEESADEVAYDRAEFAAHLFGPDAVAAVALAEIDGEVAGMALWFRTFSTWLGCPGIWLEDLFVHPRHRRHGVARALLAHLRASTAGRVEWSVLDWNESAIRVYEAIGAHPVEGWTTYRWEPASRGDDG
jgi:GNAT superfamily N-acetyltransferase